MSPRAIQYHFLRATGLGYKTIQQIERARHARALLEHGVSIPDTVLTTGYCDQAHLTNSLKRFLGPTPSQSRSGCLQESALEKPVAGIMLMSNPFGAVRAGGTRGISS